MMMTAVNVRCSTNTHARRITYATTNGRNRKQTHTKERTRTANAKAIYAKDAAHNGKAGVAVASMAYAPLGATGGRRGGIATTAVRVKPAVAHGRQKMSVRAMGNPNTTVRQDSTHTHTHADAWRKARERDWGAGRD